jgi:hypothetical protein
MLNDPSLPPRVLDPGMNIFEIIMPWVDDYRQEQEGFLKEKRDLGLIDEKEFKTSLKELQKTAKQGIVKGQEKQMTQQTLNFKAGSQKAKEEVKEEEKKKVTNKNIKFKNGEVPRTQAELFSRVIKINNVELFDWKYDQEVWDPYSR